MADDDRLINYRFDCATLGGVVPPLSRVHLIEALDEPYTLRVDCYIEDQDFEVNTLIGQDCSVEFNRSDVTARRVCGVVSEARETDEARTRLVIVPALSMLGLRRDTRIFQEMTVPEILDDVLGALGEYGRSVTLDLSGDYPTREYCVQYQETDLDFAMRLMQEEGISFGFEHEGDVEELVLRDRNTSWPDLPAGRLVAYEPDNAELRGSEPIVHFVRHHRPTTTSVVARDWDWTRGGDMVVEAEARGQGPDEADRESYEQGRGRSLSIWSYDQGVRRYQEEDSTGQSALRREAHSRDALVGIGISRVVGVAPGMVFELSGHPSVGLDDTYLILRAEHFSRASDAASGGGSPDPYHNRFECIPLATPHRPARTIDKPYVPRMQTAVVTGPSGEEIHVDEHGRIKVQFHWDRQGSNDERSSCWMRVQQPWAGAGWGFWWAPRIGMEVVVHFVDGDPDRPLVTASVYDGANPTPYALPDEKTKSTIKSNTSLGGGGFNEFRFEDKAGQEEIFTHAQKDYNEVVENDHNTLVHHDQTNTVDNDQTQEIHVDQTETIHANQFLTVDANRTVHVKSNYDETVDGTETRHVVGDVTETFDANEERTIGATLDETIGAKEERTISGNQDETVMGNYEQAVAGDATESITGSLSETVTSGITTTTPAAYDITCLGGMTVTAAAGINITAPGGVTVISPAGVTQVDDFYKWLGVQQISVGVLNHGVTGLKIEMTLTQFGATGVKYEDTGLLFENTPLDMWVGLAKIKSGGVQLYQGALKFVSNPFGIRS